MYQVIHADGTRTESTEIVVLQEWAKEGRLVPETRLRDPVRDLEFAAGEVPSLQGCFLPVVILPPEQPSHTHGSSTAALTLSIMSACIAVVGLIPCLGWMNYGTLLFGIIGAVLAARIRANLLHPFRGTANTAFVVAVAACTVGAIRLLLGGGCL